MNKLFRNVMKSHIRILLAVAMTTLYSNGVWSNNWAGGIDKDLHNGHKIRAIVQWGSSYGSNYEFKPGYTNNTIGGYIRNLKISEWNLALYRTQDRPSKGCDLFPLCDQWLEYNIYNQQTSSWEYPSSGWYKVYRTGMNDNWDNDNCYGYPDAYWAVGTSDLVSGYISDGTGGKFALNMQLVSKHGYECNSFDYYPGNNAKFVCDFTVPGFYATSLAMGTHKHDAGMQSKTFKFKAFAFGSATVRLTLPNNKPFYFDSGKTQKYYDVVNPTDDVENSVTVYFDPSDAGDYEANMTIVGTYSGNTYTKNVSVSGKSISNPVVIEGERPVVTGNSAVLTGYVQAYDCVADLYGAGFYYWKDGDAESTKIDIYTLYEADDKHPFKTRGTWSNTVTGLLPNTTYHYRPYVKKTTTGDVRTYQSEDYYNFTTSTCDPAVSDTIYYTIDASQLKDECNLIFPTIAEARTHLFSCTTSPAWITASDDSDQRKLLKHIVFQVAPGTYQNGSDGIAGKIDLTDINKFDNYTPGHKFIIRALDHENLPTLYGLDIRDSRNITIDNLNIARTTSTKGYANSAVIVGTTGGDTNARAAGYMTDANVRITNCNITGTAFCVIHITDCDGIYLENNNLIASLPSYSGDADLCDAVFWGASIKMMNVRNAKIERNNFRGAHSTSLLIQGSNNLLIMNNVFWNDNTIFDTNRKYVAFIRLLSMNQTTTGNTNQLKNIGIYYNTFYLKENTSVSDYYADFFRLAATNSCGDSQTAVKYYDGSSIEFKYNNCYSLAKGVKGKGSFNNSDPYIGLTTFDKISHNNFWSAYDGSSATVSEFALGDDCIFVNAQDQMCKTAPNDPDGLVIKGSALNHGVAVSTTVGDAVGANRVRTDRTGVSNIRPVDGTKWTYGAYQQGVSQDVNTIYWFGSEDDRWDNRNNWYKDALGKNRVSCVDNLAADLKVIIASGKPLYPVIGSWGDGTLDTGEEVRANITKSGSTYSAGKFADDINIEYGAALLGVENLYGSSHSPQRHYSQATMNFEAGRDHWLLVGAVIKRVDDDNPGGREMVSGDFYKYHEPEVYMQRVTTNSSDQIVWGVPFTETNTTIPSSSCFAIKVADEYTGDGYYKIPAKYYYRWTSNPGNVDPDKEGSAVAKYSFTGFFINEENMSTYSIPANGYGFFNNTYPANIDVKLLQAALNGNCTLYFYKYRVNSDGSIGGSWQETSQLVTGENYYIRPQNGFVIKNTSSAASVAMQTGYFNNSGESTKYITKRASADTKLIMETGNAVSGGSSRLAVIYGASNSTALVGVDPGTPVVYVPQNDLRYGVYGINDESRIVPLSVLNQSGKPMHVTFKLLENMGFESIVLEDRLTNTSYDLLDSEAPTFYSLASGVTEGRFFLNLNYAQEGGGNPDIPTKADEAQLAESIDIFNVGNHLTISVSDNGIIEKIFVSDMAGRTFELEPNGSVYSTHTLPLADGVYVVTVLTTKSSAKQKIVVDKK